MPAGLCAGGLFMFLTPKFSATSKLIWKSIPFRLTYQHTGFMLIIQTNGYNVEPTVKKAKTEAIEVVLISVLTNTNMCSIISP